MGQICMLTVLLPLYCVLNMQVVMATMDPTRFHTFRELAKQAAKLEHDAWELPRATEVSIETGQDILTLVS